MIAEIIVDVMSSEVDRVFDYLVPDFLLDITEGYRAMPRILSVSPPQLLCSTGKTMPKKSFPQRQSMRFMIFSGRKNLRKTVFSVIL